ncbi:CKLF-like MARVEL transmembrane domain-containing protein 5 [Lutra lutra]|uniref:CKLF-like MARVEL transmembrane domain-containing protein 5 n=1 Tax=Lutra lutra TaxID=9657 RepID=UPI001FD35D1C|nr:CKLF-like MARVEL transmembrane domain-containing protein 5 [Lutra lutra]
MCFPGWGGDGAGTSRGTLGSWEKARLAERGSLAAPRPTSPLFLQVSPSASLLLFASPSLQVSVFPVPFSGWWQWGLCLVGPTEMLSARDRRDGLPAEGAAAGLQGFAVDKTFLSSLKGILLETELALTFVIFICFTASISAYMAAALLEFFITLAFLFLYATQYYLRFDRLNWPCLDFLRCVSAIIIFLVVSFAAVTSRDGAAIAAFVFGIILVSVFAYDAFKIYRTEMAPRTTQEDQQ